MRQYGDDLPLRRIRPEKCQPRARGYRQLLLLRAGELTKDCLRDCRRRLQGEGVQEHVRGGRHLDGFAQKPARLRGTDIRVGLEDCLLILRFFTSSPLLNSEALLLHSSDDWWAVISARRHVYPGRRLSLMSMDRAPSNFEPRRAITSIHRRMIV